MTPVTTRLYLPYDRPPLSLNDRRNRHQHAREVREVRRAVQLIARAARLGRHDHVTVALHYAPARGGRRDTDNLVATLKPVCDGLIDAGLVADDDPAHMTKPMPIIWPPDRALPPNRRLWLDITVGPRPTPTGDPVHIDGKPAFTEADAAAFHRLLTTTTEDRPAPATDVAPEPDVEIEITEPASDVGDPPPADEPGDGDSDPITVVMTSVIRADGTHIQASAYLNEPMAAGQLARAVRACSAGALAQATDLDA